MRIQRSALYRNLLRDLKAHMRIKDLSSFRAGNYPRTLKLAQSCHLANSIFKKWIPENSEKADSRAILTFLERNYECSKWSLVLVDL